VRVQIPLLAPIILTLKDLFLSAFDFSRGHLVNIFVKASGTDLPAGSFGGYTTQCRFPKILASYFPKKGKMLCQKDENASTYLADAS
jgi:hypothetical protein